MIRYPLAAPKGRISRRRATLRCPSIPSSPGIVRFRYTLQVKRITPFHFRAPVRSTTLSPYMTLRSNMFQCHSIEALQNTTLSPYTILRSNTLQYRSIEALQNTTPCRFMTVRDRSVLGLHPSSKQIICTQWIS